MAAAQQAATAEEDIASTTRELTTALATLNLAARQALEAEFRAAIEAGSLPGAKVLQEQYRTAGFDSIIVQSMFRGFARELTTALATLNLAARQALEAEFRAAIEAGSLPGAKVLQEQYRTAGFDSIIVQSMFRGFARERLLVSGQGQEVARAV